MYVGMKMYRRRCTGAHDFFEGAHVGGVFDANRHAVGLLARVSGFKMMGFGYVFIYIYICRYM